MFGGSDPQGLGRAARGTDPFNSDAEDEAIVFTQSFRPEIFSVPPDVIGLGTAIGNVASHEVGHLLGLEHGFGTTSLMNALVSLDRDSLLSDLRFVDVTVIDTLLIEIPVLTTFATSEIGLLYEIVGRAQPVTASVLPVGTSPSGITIGDWDRDGNLDLAIANHDSANISIYSNNGGGVFGNASVIPLDWEPEAITSASLLGNDILDLVTVSPFGGNHSIVGGRADGTFEDAITVDGNDIGLSDLALADLDSDGDLDFLLLNRIFNTLRVLPNTAIDSPMQAVAFEVGGSFDRTSNSVIAADVDGDDDVDLVAAQLVSGTVTIFLNDGAGAFPTRSMIDLNVPDGLLAIVREFGAVDLDRDNDVDFVFVLQGLDNIVVALNQGDGTFSDAVGYVVGDNPDALVLSDLNGDGSPDVAVTNAISGDVSVLLNVGDGTFDPERVFPTAANPTSIAAGDLDGDGDADLVVVFRDADSISILFNAGDGTFGRPEDIPAAAAVRSARIGYGIDPETEPIESTDRFGQTDVDCGLTRGACTDFRATHRSNP